MGVLTHGAGNGLPQLLRCVGPSKKKIDSMEQARVVVWNFVMVRSTDAAGGGGGGVVAAATC